VLMDAEVDAACGPKGRHDADRVAYRHGSEAGSVTLGGRRVAVRRPRVRAVDGSGEVTINAYQVFTDNTSCATSRPMCPNECATRWRSGCGPRTGRQQRW
jgi:hypothetical protein